MRANTPAEEAPLPGFSDGALLGGLADLHPRSRHSCCEVLGVMFGVETSSHAALRLAYERLMARCAHLPSAVHGHAGIQRKLDALHDDVAAFKRKDIQPGERFDELVHLGTLNRRAVGLYHEIAAHERSMRQRQQTQVLNLDVVPMAAASVPPVPFDAGADEPPVVDAQAALRRREVPRRRDRPIAVVEPMAPAQAAAARPAFELGAAGHRALRQAVETAQQQANGANRIGGRDMLVLGRAIAGLVNGRFTSHSSHASDTRERQYDIRAVINMATQNMRHDQRDAIREAAAAHLQDEHAGHLD